MAIAFLLSVQGLDGATNATCYINVNVLEQKGENKTVKICEPEIDKVDDEDFTILSASGTTYLEIQNKKGVKFLPTNLFRDFNDLVSIRVSGCSLTSVSEIHFKGLSKLKILNLENNKIDHIASDAFIDLVALELLYLSYNRIQFLGANTFSSLENLEQLFLDNNEIQLFQPKIFNSLANVKFINLDNNEIFILDENIFEAAKNLTEITIGNNKLEKISRTLFNNNLNLEKILLHGNKISYVSTLFNTLPKLNRTLLEQSISMKGEYTR